MDMQTALDAPGLKVATREQWNEAAAGWNEHAPWIREWLAATTSAMLDLAGVAAGSRVLDVAAGTGDQTLDIARRVGPGGRVVATDISPGVLALARANLQEAGHDWVQTLVADAEDLPAPLADFDAVVCRLGWMLCPDPLQALREAHRVLKPGGMACAVVFGAPARNPCIAGLMATALKHAGLAPRDPWQPGGLVSLGKPGLLDELFRQAGFREVATTAIDAPFRMKSAAHYLDFVRSSASPIRQILERLPAQAAQAAWAEMEERLSAFKTGDGWVGPNELLLTAGRR